MVRCTQAGVVLCADVQIICLLAHCIDGCIPETVISGETEDISPFCEFSFWVWVKFRDKGVAFPDDQMVLGHYLGPIIDVGPAMTQHVMKANGKYEN